MTLSERLDHAARIRAGEPVDLRDASPVEEAPASVEITIILPPAGPVASVTPDPSAEDGSSCPTCGRPGQLSLIDLPRQTTDWQCTTCATLWRSRQLRQRGDRGQSLLPPMRG